MYFLGRRANPSHSTGFPLSSHPQVIPKSSYPSHLISRLHQITTTTHIILSYYHTLLSYYHIPRSSYSPYSHFPYFHAFTFSFTLTHLLSSTPFIHSSSLTCSSSLSLFFLLSSLSSSFSLSLLICTLLSHATQTHQHQRPASAQSVYTTMNCHPAPDLLGYCDNTPLLPHAVPAPVPASSLE